MTKTAAILPQGVLTMVVLALLIISAVMIRLNNFQKTEYRTVDEVVYSHLGAQLQKGLAYYHTQELAQARQNRHPSFRPLSPYFYQPVFKYPPLFAGLIALARQLINQQELAAYAVALFFSVAHIPLIYALGMLLFNKRTGLWAALIYWLDPVAIICSQKIWMDSMLSFFMLLCLTLFYYAYSRGRDRFFIASGLAAGLAVLTKEIGILMPLLLLIFVLLYDPQGRQRQYFWSIFTVPLLMYCPWIAWNAHVYGAHLLPAILRAHELGTLLTRIGDALPSFAIILFLITGCGYAFYRMRQSPLAKRALGWCAQQPALKNQTVSGIIGFLLLVSLFYPAMIHSLDFHYFPTTSWVAGTFAQEDRLFYFRRLIEFSPFYLFAFWGLVPKSKNTQTKFLKVISMGIILFFSLWGNFQSRYILAAIPLLILLGIITIQSLYKDIRDKDGFRPRRLAIGLLVGVLLFALIKIYRLNLFLSYPNDLCYF